MNSVSYFAPFTYHTIPVHWNHIGVTSVTQLPDIAGLCNCMLAFLRSLYGVPRQCCLQGTPYSVFSSQRASNCVFVFADSNRRIGESNDGFLYVWVLCVCFKLRAYLVIRAIRIHAFYLCMIAPFYAVRVCVLSYEHILWYVDSCLVSVYNCTILCYVLWCYTNLCWQVNCFDVAAAGRLLKMKALKIILFNYWLTQYCILTILLT